MSALDDRRRADLAKVQALAASSGGRMAVVAVDGDPMRSVTIELRYVTVIDEQYPNRRADRIKATITLSAKYPMQEPSVMLSPAVFHPNVWASGQVCLGAKWLPTQGLDLLVRRLAQIVTFEPAVLNDKSPASSSALNWYRSAVRSFPRSFPTDRPAFSPQADRPSGGMSWQNVGTAEAPKVIVECPSCRQRLSVAAGRSGRIRCPACNNSFDVRT